MNIQGVNPWVNLSCFKQKEEKKEPALQTYSLYGWGMQTGFSGKNKILNEKVNELIGIFFHEYKMLIWSSHPLYINICMHENNITTINYKCNPTQDFEDTFEDQSLLILSNEHARFNKVWKGDELNLKLTEQINTILETIKGLFQKKYKEDFQSINMCQIGISVKEALVIDGKIKSVNPSFSLHIENWKDVQSLNLHSKFK